MNRSTHIRRASFMGAALLATILTLGASTARAQRFQSHFGDPNCVDAGRAGVTQLSSGGYVAVGESGAAGCPTPHIYVVFTTASGTISWSSTYTIGVEDSATDVIETSTGDIAICGVTRNGCGPMRDAFIMKINPSGAFLGVHTYGDPNSDEIAWGICEANVGSPAGSPDLVIAGSTTFGGGSRQGYIVRIDWNLNPIWDNVYSLGSPGFLDLYDVIESKVGPGAGDIVAVGRNFGQFSALLDAAILRVNGQNGQVGPSPQGMALYGGQQDDEARAVIEIQSSTNLTPGDLVIVGSSFSRPSPSTNLEALLIQTSPDPCAPLVEAYAGDDGPDADAAFDLKEDIHTNNQVIVTGYTSSGTAAILAPNVFLERFALGSFMPSGGGMFYGGVGDDIGWSVNTVVNQGFAGQTSGYVVAGFTTSQNLIGTDPEELYLIKTDVGLSSNCNEGSLSINWASAGLATACVTPYIQPLGLDCVPNINSNPVSWGTQLCYTFPSNREQGNGGNDGVSGVESPAVISFDEGTVASYPNPITSGTALNLRFDLASGADVQLSVSDLVGREIYRDAAHAEAGSALRTIDTKGWSSGTYLVRVAIGAKSATMRVVVLDR